MKAGKMDRRIRLEILTASTQSASGAVTPGVWIPLREVWAERLEQTGREMFRAQQLVAEITTGWRIRWDAVVAAITPNETNRVVDAAGVEYDIVSFTEEGRREGLLIMAKARAEQ